MKKTALLIIDMQNDFVQKDAPLRVKGALGMVSTLEKVLRICREKNAPIFHIVRVHRKDASDVEITRKEKFITKPFAVSGTKGAEIINELKPKDNEYLIKKIRMSSFINTDLDFMLRSLGIERLILAGIQTPNCVRQTAFDAIAYNYITYLVKDATAAQTEEIHAQNLRDMENIGIQLISSDEVQGFFD